MSADWRPRAVSDAVGHGPSISGTVTLDPTHPIARNGECHSVAGRRKGPPRRPGCAGFALAPPAAAAATRTGLRERRRKQGMHMHDLLTSEQREQVLAMAPAIVID